LVVDNKGDIVFTEWTKSESEEQVIEDMQEIIDIKKKN
jgi:hypothetical protein